jgi:hypothetical protein
MVFGISVVGDPFFLNCCQPKALTDNKSSRLYLSSSDGKISLLTFLFIGLPDCRTIHQGNVANATGRMVHRVGNNPPRKKDEVVGEGTVDLNTQGGSLY